MSTPRSIVRIVTVAGVSLALFTACSKSSPLKPIAAEQVPQVLNDAFKQSKPEANAAAQEVISSAQAGDPVMLQQAHELGVRPDLTDEQRRAAYRVAAALHQKMAEDAARGDQKAEEALKAYRASK